MLSAAEVLVRLAGKACVVPLFCDEMLTALFVCCSTRTVLISHCDGAAEWMLDRRRPKLGLCMHCLLVRQFFVAFVLCLREWKIIMGIPSKSWIRDRGNCMKKCESNGRVWMAYVILWLLLFLKTMFRCLYNSPDGHCEHYRVLIGSIIGGGFLF